MTKPMFLIFLVILDVAYLRTIIAGRSLHAKRKMHADEPASPHQWNAYVFLFWLVLLVLAIEICVRKIGGSIFDPLLCAHLGIAGPLLLVSILLVYPFNGERKKRYHRWLAYSSAMLMLGVNVTGIPMILSRF